MLTTTEAVHNLRKAIEERSFIQGRWSVEDHGRHLGCLLHQMGGTEIDIGNSGDCPASVMPQWLAAWVPNAFDGVNADAIYDVASDFAATLESTVGWGPERWERLRVDFLCGLIDQAIAAAEPVSKELSCWPAVVDACKRVQDALRGIGYLKTAEEAAREAAREAAWAAAGAAARAARAARAATEAAAWAAAEAAWAAAWAAREAAGAARAATEAAALEAAGAAAALEVAYREQFAMLRRLASA